MNKMSGSASGQMNALARWKRSAFLEGTVLNEQVLRTHLIG